MNTRQAPIARCSGHRKASPASAGSHSTAGLATPVMEGDGFSETVWGKAKKPKRKNKYRAQKTVVDGITFDSKAEARRYGELKLLEQAGEISGLELQPKFPIEVNGKKICTWKGDFRYWCNRSRGWVVEDVKGVRTPVYCLKKKLAEAIYGIEVMEVKA